MRLYITSDIPLPEDFLNALTSDIQKFALSSLHEEKLDAWNTYMSKQERFRKLGSSISHDVSDIIRFAISVLQWYEISEGAYEIRLPHGVYVPGYDRVDVENVCRMINYGTLSVAAYPFFSQVFNYFTEHLDQYTCIYFNALGE